MKQLTLAILFFILPCYFISAQTVKVKKESQKVKNENAPGFQADLEGKPEDVAPAWTEALRADRPFVLETIVDTNVPPLPPHVTLEQATAITRAMFRGDPHRAAVIRQSFRDLVEDFLPHPG